jgi:hypothetical protein
MPLEYAPLRAERPERAQDETWRILPVFVRRSKSLNWPTPMRIDLNQIEGARCAVSTRSSSERELATLLMTLTEQANRAGYPAEITL